MSRKRQMSLWTSNESMPESQSMFNRTRLTIVRKRMGLTKIELARKAGFGLRSIAAYELGEYPQARRCSPRSHLFQVFPLSSSMETT